MTAPPGGPYGQGPYGQGPYGQGPYGTNPYGQDPYWGGQPQSGPYQYPPGGPYGNPQSGMDPYAPAGYQPQQYPSGWPGGSYPPGPPPNRPGSKMPWLIITGIAVLGVIVLVVILAVALSNRNTSSTAGPSGTTPSQSAATSQPNNSQQTATGCTPNVSGGDASGVGSTISAGKLSFPASAAPGWTPYSDDQNPNLIDAVGLGQEVPGANQWMQQVEVAITNFVPSMDISQQASKLMDCVASGPGYSQSSPTLGSKKTSSITVDGVKAARVDADITIADTSRKVKGDTVTIIAVDTKPVTIFLGATPIGDPAPQAVVNQVIAALKVAK